MALVVFLRAVNVGGSKTFKPSQLPDKLPAFEIKNIGAAGTYVVRGRDDGDAVAAAVLESLPFETDVMVRSGQEILGLLDGDPLDRAAEEEGIKAYLSILAQAPNEVPALPVERPEDGPWQLRITDVEPGHALSLRRPEVPGRHYPNAVVEKVLGVAATTRGWGTVERIGAALG